MTLTSMPFALRKVKSRTEAPSASLPNSLSSTRGKFWPEALPREVSRDNPARAACCKVVIERSLPQAPRKANPIAYALNSVHGVRLIPPDRAPFVLLLQPAEQGLEILHHGAGREVLACRVP